MSSARVIIIGALLAGSPLAIPAAAQDARVGAAGALERGYDGLGPRLPVRRDSGLSVGGGYDSENGWRFRFRYRDRDHRPRRYGYPLVIIERDRDPAPETAGKGPVEPLPVPAVAAPDPVDPTGPALRSRAFPVAAPAAGERLPEGAVLVMLRDWEAFGLDAPGPGQAWARLGQQVILLREADRQVVRVLGESPED